MKSDVRVSSGVGIATVDKCACLDMWCHFYLVAPSLATRAACPLPMQRGPQARHTLMPVWRAPHPQLPSQQPLLLQVPRPQGLPCLGA